MDYTIDRTKWQRGQIGTLLDGTGCMCALGYVAMHHGVPPKRMLHAAALPEVSTSEQMPGWLEQRPGFRAQNTELAYDVLRENDKPNVSDADRETSLIRVFQTAGHTLTFVN